MEEKVPDIKTYDPKTQDRRPGARNPIIVIGQEKRRDEEESDDQGPRLKRYAKMDSELVNDILALFK